MEAALNDEVYYCIWHLLHCLIFLIRWLGFIRSTCHKSLLFLFGFCLSLGAQKEKFLGWGQVMVTTSLSKTRVKPGQKQNLARTRPFPFFSFQINQQTLKVWNQYSNLKQNKNKSKKRKENKTKQNKKKTKKKKNPNLFVKLELNVHKSGSG